MHDAQPCCHTERCANTSSNGQKCIKLAAMVDPVAATATVARSPDATAQRASLNLRSEHMEIFLNTLLHIFLLSLFIIIFFYMRALPLERQHFVAQSDVAADIFVSKVHKYLEEIGRGDGVTKNAICSITPNQYRAFRSEVLSSLAARADVNKTRRERNNTRLRVVAYIFVGLIAMTTGLLFIADTGRPKEIFFWNALTFVVFTLFELYFFVSIASQVSPVSSGAARDAFARGVYGEATSRGD